LFQDVSQTESDRAVNIKTFKTVVEKIYTICTAHEQLNIIFKAGIRSGNC
jgi:hypothetical protein